jgi:hypothetical protein
VLYTAQAQRYVTRARLIEMKDVEHLRGRGATLQPETHQILLILELLIVACFCKLVLVRKISTTRTQFPPPTMLDFPNASGCDDSKSNPRITGWSWRAVSKSHRFERAQVISSKQMQTDERKTELSKETWREKKQKRRQKIAKKQRAEGTKDKRYQGINK